MKTWKFLGAPLMLMLLAGMPWCIASAEDDRTEPVVVNAGENVTVGNITVDGSESAISVVANPTEEDAKDATVTVNGNVSLQHDSDAVAIYAESVDGGQATATVKGNVKSKASGGNACGVLAGRNSDKSTTTVKVSGGVSSEGQDNSTGIMSYNSDVNVDSDVTATTGYYSTGVLARADQKATVSIKENVSASGNIATGLMVESYGDSDQTGDLSLTVGKNVTATSTASEEEEEIGKSDGILLSNCGGNFTVDVKGDVKAKAPGGGQAAGLWISTKTINNPRVASVAQTPRTLTHNDDNQTTTSPTTEKNSILLHKNLISDGVGILRELSSEEMSGPIDVPNRDNKVNVLVEEVLDAKDVGVLLREYSPTELDPNLNLTVWKIKLNDNNNAAEKELAASEPDIHVANAETLPKDSRYKLNDESQTSRLNTRGNASTRTTARDFELNNIMYIIKVEQPSEGGTITAVDENGNDLAKSFGFDVAHEGEKVMLKANLEEGYKIIAAYNGLGEKQPLLKDEKGNYYIFVPKGGGVYLSAELEDTTEHSYSKPENDEKESIKNETSNGDLESKDKDAEELDVSPVMPKTGDNARVMPWLIISVVSIGGISIIELYNKKAKRIYSN